MTQNLDRKQRTVSTYLLIMNSHLDNMDEKSVFDFGSKKKF